MLFVGHPKILHKHCFQFLLGLFQLPRETEDNAYAKFGGDKQRALSYEKNPRKNTRERTRDFKLSLSLK